MRRNASPLRALKSAAPLKRVRFVPVAIALETSPRPQKRGPVEAPSSSQNSSSGVCLSAPSKARPR